MENSFKKVYVLDTNIILNDAMQVFEFSQNEENLIVIPETVLDEVDEKKTGFDDINFQARNFARILADGKIRARNESKIGENRYDIVEISLSSKGSKATIHIVSKDTYTVSKKNVSRSIYNDRKILELTKDLSKIYKGDNPIFLSMDIMARVRAISLGLTTNTVGKSENQDEFIFHKEIKTNLNNKDDIDGKYAKDIDKNYHRETFSYTVEFPNKETALFLVQDEKMVFIDEKRARDQRISPKNRGQLLFSSALLSNYYDIFVVDSQAGTGKTLIALSGAIKLVDEKRYDKITYIRNSIDSLDKGEDVGAVSGNKAKFQKYYEPLEDSIRYMIEDSLQHQSERKKKSDQNISPAELINKKYIETIRKYNIETLWSGALRGRTITNSVVIIDEAQNMSKKTLQLILSRIGANCIVIILGSNKQIDNYYINKHTNGLYAVLASTKKEDNHVKIFAITLEKVLRGPVTAWAEEIFE